nr:permease [Amylibacter sp.]
MTDLSSRLDPWKGRKIDKAWLAIILVFVAVAALVPQDFWEVGQATVRSVLSTAPFIAFAVATVAYLKATGAEGIVAQAFKGSPVRMIVLAAMVGGIAPFCSCEVIPFVAALLAMGVPLAAVMAFWLSSPIMDPPMFIITSSALGVDFAIAKTIAAVCFGLFGGFAVMAFNRTALFTDPLRETAQAGGCGCGTNPFTGKPVWAFWSDPERVQMFRTTAVSNALFLLKWLTLAYTIEAVMVRYVPAEWIANILGGEGFGPILLGALVGGPAYLNGYAAAPLVGGLISQGMSQGAAMSFMMAGSVSCIPAAIAVWALVKPKVFLAYIGFGFTGSLMAGLLWAAWVQ